MTAVALALTFPQSTVVALDIISSKCLPVRILKRLKIAGTSLQLPKRRVNLLPSEYVPSILRCA